MKKKTGRYFRQPVLKAGVVNLNGRKYTIEALEKMLDDLEPRILQGRLLGELGYPERHDTSLSKASHVIEKARIKGDVLEVDGRFLDTPQGDAAHQMLEQNLIVLRPRSAGTVEADGNVNVKKVFTFDWINRADDAWKEIL